MKTRSFARLARIWARVFRAEKAADTAAVKARTDVEFVRQQSRRARLARIRWVVEALAAERRLT